MAATDADPPPTSALTRGRAACSRSPHPSCRPFTSIAERGVSWALEDGGAHEAALHLTALAHSPAGRSYGTASVAFGHLGAEHGAGGKPST
jgi:hypothetical protein